MKALSVGIASIVLLGSSPTSPPTGPAPIRGVTGPGFQACSLSSDGMLTATASAPAFGVRFVLYGENHRWIGEQSVFGIGQQARFQARLLASQSSIEQFDVVAMQCAALARLEECKGGPIVDNGPDLDLDSILATRDAISVRLNPHYSNYFSQQQGLLLHDQLYFVRLDDRAEVKFIVTDVSAQPMAFYFDNVKAGAHRVSFGWFQDYFVNTPHVERIEKAECFSKPSS